MKSKIVLATSVLVAKLISKWRFYCGEAHLNQCDIIVETFVHGCTDSLRQI